MLHFDRIDVYEGTNVNEISPSKEFIICHYPYFLHKAFKFQPNVCKRCCGVLTYLALNNIAILNIHRVDYRCIINGINISEAVNLL